MRPRASLLCLLTVACHVARAPRLEPAPARATTPSTTSPIPPAATVATAPSATALPKTATGAPSTSALPATAAAAPPPGPCPSEMALVERAQGTFCIDRWEATVERRTSSRTELWPSNVPVDGHEAELLATSVPGRKPQGYISGEQAARACENAGKRLCSMDEWVRACRGPRRTTYPYGGQRRADACNDHSLSPPPHPVIRLFELFAPEGTNRAAMWQPAWMNDPRLHELPNTVEPTGSRAACTNEHGVYDMVGNLHEWIADPEGTFVGGFFMDTVRNGEGCAYRTSAHTARYRDYSTGFRCCRDPLLH